MWAAALRTCALLLAAACVSSPGEPDATDSPVGRPHVINEGAPSPAANPATPPDPGLRLISGTWVAGFIDETVYDGTDIVAGAPFTKSWIVRNVGTATWTTGTCLRFDGVPYGLRMSTTSSTCVAGTVLPGAQVTFQVPMIAPSQTGSHREDWRLETPTGQRVLVGGSTVVWVDIDVVAATWTAGLDDESPLDDHTFAPGAAFTKRWVLRNTGTAIWPPSTTCLNYDRVATGNRMSSTSRVCLSAPVAPNHLATFDVPMVAPSTGAVHEEHWKLLDPGGSTVRVGGSSTVWARIRVSGPTWIAALDAETWPDRSDVVVGASFDKVWTLRNAGTATWPSGTCLRFDRAASGTRLSSASSSCVPGQVAPGGQVALSVPMVAPMTTGTWREDWRLQDPSGSTIPVGGSSVVWVEVDTVAALWSATLTDEDPADDTTFAAGASFTKTWTLLNSGNVTWPASSTCLRYDRVAAGSRLSSTDTRCLSGSVAPGQSTTLSVPMLTPTAPGAHEEHWRFKSPAGATIPVGGSSTVWVRIIAAAPSLQAHLVSETIADGTDVAVGAAFDKSWTLSNSGSTSWPSGTCLRFDRVISGQRLSTIHQICLGSPTVPGAQVTLTVPMVAPWTVGRQREDWRLESTLGAGIAVDASDVVWVEIDTVTAALSAALAGESPPDDSTFAPGASFTRQWQLRNTGGGTWPASTTCVEHHRVSIGSRLSTVSSRCATGGVAPGQTLTVDVPMVAPAQPGTHEEHWQLRSGGTVVPVGGSTTVWARFIVAGVDRAALLSETVPDGTDLLPGQRFQKRWTLRNDGAYTWNGAWELRHVSGAMSDDTRDRPVSTTTPPGSSLTFDVAMTAPLTGTSVEDHWQLVGPAGVVTVTSSATVWARVDVLASATAEWVSETVPDGTSFALGTSFDKAWTLRNAGSAPWPADTRLERVGPAVLSDLSSLPPVGAVAAGHSRTFTVPMQAPDQEGVWQEDWQLKGGGVVIPVRGAGEAWSTDRIWARVHAERAPTADPLPELDTTNPSPSQVSDALDALALSELIPPVFLKVIAYKEGATDAKWKQYWPEPGAQTYGCGSSFPYATADVVRGWDVVASDGCRAKSVGHGIMQITERLITSAGPGDALHFYDPVRVQRVSTSWRANVEAGADTLWDKWIANSAGMSGCDADPTILENWWYALAWYNGSGTAAAAYVADVEALTRGDRPVQADIGAFIPVVPELGSAGELPWMPSTSIPGDPDASEFYLLTDLVADGQKIHRWVGGEVYVDITADVAAGRCAPAVPTTTAPPVPSAVQAFHLEIAGTLVTLLWEPRPSTERVGGHEVAWRQPTDLAWTGASIDDQTSWLVSVSPGSWEFRVRACNVSGCGAWSEVLGASLESGGTTPAVWDLQADYVDGAIVSSWSTDAAPGAARYDVEVTDLDRGSLRVSQVTVPRWTVSHPADGLWSIRVRACTTGSTPTGCSPWTSPATVLVSTGAEACKVLVPGEPLRNLTVTAGELRRYCFSLPEGVEVLTLTMSGRGLQDDPEDADLYLKHGGPVTADDVARQEVIDDASPILIAPWEDGSLEAITVYDPPAGVWFVGVHGAPEVAGTADGDVDHELGLHWHGAGREHLPEGFQPEPDGISTLYSPVDPESGAWWTAEALCAEGRAPADWRTQPSCDIEQREPPIGLSCFTTCISGGHVSGDHFALDVNLDGAADVGEAITAPMEGIIRVAANHSGYDYNVVLQSVHDANLAVRLAHMDPSFSAWTPDYQVGDRVEAGRLLGHVAVKSMGGKGSPHLHLAAYRDMAGTADGLAEAQAQWQRLRSGWTPSYDFAAMLPFYLDEFLAPGEEASASAATVEARSPVALAFVDAQGRRSGPTGFGTLQLDIPGVLPFTLHRAGELTDVLRIATPVAGGVMFAQGIGAGTAGIGLSVHEDDVHALAWLDRPVSESTVAFVSFTGDGAPGDLVISDPMATYISAPAFDESLPAVHAVRIDARAPAVLQQGTTVVVLGAGFGEPIGGALPGTLELRDQLDLWRPFTIELWSDGRIEATLSEAPAPGRYALSVLRQPERYVSASLTVDIAAPGALPGLHAATPPFAVSGAPATLTLFGHGFDATTAVTVSGLAAQVEVIDAGTARVIVPDPGPGTFPLQVRTSGGDATLPLTWYAPADDADGDGLTPRAELVAGTAPDDPDSDGDGVDDRQDRFPTDAAAWRDLDGDHVDDARDDDDDGDGADDASDCGPSDPTIHPGAAERVGDAVDQDCDGQDACYTDADGDGWGTDRIIDGPLGCMATHTSRSVGDCDDALAGVHPDAIELPEDGVDQDCDGIDGMTLAVSPLTLLQPATFTLEGARAFETVHLVRGQPGGPGPGSCPPALLGTCLGVQRPAVLATLRADGLGNKTWSVTLPATAPTGPIAFQAVSLRPTGPVYSRVVTRVILDPAADWDGDGVIAAADCDDTDPARAPGFVEVCDNGVDDDCDGQDLACFDEVELTFQWWSTLGPVAALVIDVRHLGADGLPVDDWATVTTAAGEATATWTEPAAHTGTRSEVAVYHDLGLGLEPACTWLGGEPSLPGSWFSWGFAEAWVDGAYLVPAPTLAWGSADCVFVLAP